MYQQLLQGMNDDYNNNNDDFKVICNIKSIKSRASEHYRKMRMIAWFMTRRYFIFFMYIKFFCHSTILIEKNFLKNIFHLHSVLYRAQQRHPINWNELFSIMIYYFPLKKRKKDREWNFFEINLFEKFVFNVERICRFWWDLKRIYYEFRMY